MDEQNLISAEAGAEQAPEKETYSKKEVEEMMRARAQSANRAKSEAEARAQKAEMERQAIHEQHQAMLQEMNVKKQESPQSPGMVPIEAVKQLMQESQQQARQQGQVQSYMGKVNKAAEEDPELKNLMDKGNHIAPLIPLIAGLDYLPNAAAVTKHLLKDKADYAVLANTVDQGAMVKFINDISNKLSGVEPKASEFKPAPVMSSPDGEEEFSGLSYWKNKNGR